MSRNTPSKIRTRREHMNEGSIPEIPVRDTGIFEYSPSGQSVKIKAKHLVYQNSALAVINKRRSSEANQTSNVHELPATNQAPDMNVNTDPGIILPNSMPEESQSKLSRVKSGGTKNVELSGFLYSLWRNQKMCDIIIRVNGSEYKAHKLALAAHSEKFTSNYCERLPTTVSEVNLSNSSTEAVEDILRYIYTSELNLDIHNIDSVTGCAKQLGITSVLDLCRKYLLKHDVQTVFTMWIIAEKHGLVDVLSRLEMYICERFPDVYKSLGFLNGHFEQIWFFICKDNLHINSELDIFLAASTWIDFNRQERLRYASELTSCVRFVDISPGDLATHVEPVDHIFQIKECREMLFEAYRYHALKNSSGKSDGGNSDVPGKRSSVNANPDIPNSRPRMHSTESSNAVIATSGNRHRTLSADSVSKRYSTDIAVPQNSKTSTFSHGNRFEAETSNLSQKGNYHRPSYADASSKYTLYGSQMSFPPLPLPPRPTTLIAIGGVDPFNTDSEVACRLVEQYNPRTNSWHLLSSLPEPRHHLGVAVLDGFIYVIGGSVLNRSDPDNLANPTDVCFRFDPHANYWSRIASLRQPRMYLSVCVLEGVLYALGGNDSYGRSLDTVEYYDPDADMWGLTAPMSETKIGTAAVGFRGLLHVVGGFQEHGNQKIVLNSAESYDPRTNSWIRRNPLPIRCCHASLVEAKGNLYLLGGSTIPEGQTNINSLSSVFRHSNEDDHWDLVVNMRISRHDAGAAVIDKIKQHLHQGVSIQREKKLLKVSQNNPFAIVHFRDSRIYVIGGVSSDEGRALTEMECLDVELMTWLEGLDCLSHPALGIACCSFDGDDIFTKSQIDFT